MVKAFRRFGHIFKELNRTYITLVPRTVNMDSVNHYRPINLCNISYTIISKILTNRLKKVLRKIISSFIGRSFKTKIFMMIF